MRMWDAGTGECVRTLEGHSSHVFSVAWSPDGSKVGVGVMGQGRCACGTGTGYVRTWRALP